MEAQPLPAASSQASTTLGAREKKPPGGVAEVVGARVSVPPGPKV
jgi:hypothetical protein